MTIAVRTTSCSLVKVVKSETRVMANSSWQFINASELEDGRDGETRKLIRANVTRDYHLKQKGMEKQQKRLLPVCPKPSGSDSHSISMVPSSNVGEHADLMHLQSDLMSQDQTFQ